MTTAPAITVSVPADSAARSVGADQVAADLATEAARRHLDVTIVRTGSRGLYWLEPLVEVHTAAGRIGFGPIGDGDVAPLIEAIASGPELDAPNHRRRVGLMEDLDWLARQQRVTFRRVGVIEPLSTKDHLAQGGNVALARALSIGPHAVRAEVTTSGLRGRGGAGFPAGIKWETAATAPGTRKFVCCNADEGDSGTYADRMVMEGDPYRLLEGITICAVAIGAHEAFIYIRSEYPDAVATMTEAVRRATEVGWLGGNILGSEFALDVQIRVGAGAYICGEETAMLESLEGKRGVVRAKPPLPAITGLFGCPTVINNVLTLATVPAVIDTPESATRYHALGFGRSRGTQVFQLGGNVAHGGIVEVPFGLTLRELVEDYGGGTASGRPLRAVQVGGPLGSYLPADQLELPMDYESFTAAGALIGHGGIVVFDDSVDMAAQARFAMEFCAVESCGKCTPCRIGSTRGVEVIDRIVAGERRAENLELLDDLCDTMADASLCAMGGLTPLPVRSALRYFPQDFHRNPER
jgi:formate dehydrogenase iron-sulfur subunit